MDVITEPDINRLKAINQPGCISIYLPTKPGVFDIRQNQIPLKDILKQAKIEFLDEGLSEARFHQLVRPIEQLLTNTAFWRQASSCLVIFAGPRFFRAYRLPFSCKKVLSIGGGFNLAPLIRSLKNESQFYLLALSQNHTQLYQATNYQIKPVRVVGLPRNLQADLRIDEVFQGLQTHEATRVDKEGFHGQGGFKDERKKDILRYFQHIDRVLCKFLRAKPAPLVLAMVEYLAPLYRQANTYPYLATKVVAGNPDRLEPKSLHQKALTVLKQGQT